MRFGFELSEETFRLQNEYLSNVNCDMCYHRIKKELVETFNLNNQKAFNKFIEQEIYKLLGKNQVIPKIDGSIQENVKNNNIQQPWIVYMGFFNLSNLALTRREKRIVEWYNRLQNGDKITNNTPIESIIMSNLKGKKVI